MRIDGVWHLCDDGAVRPVMLGEVQTQTGDWIKLRFLVDTGADRTVFSADVLERLGLPPIESDEQISGIGGATSSAIVRTQIRFANDENGRMTLSGRFAVVTAVEALDMSVLGRDVIDLCSLLVDRPGDRVVLFGQQHRCTIERHPAP
jgi:predicted aspartyl protease